MANNTTSRNLKETKKTLLPEWSFEEFAGGLSEVIILINSDMQIIFANDATGSLFGYSVGEILEKKLEILLPKEFIERHIQILFDSSIMAPPVIFGEDQKIFGKNRKGGDIPLEVTLTYRIWKGESLVLVTARDISMLVTSRTVLDEVEQRYRGIVDSQNALVVSVDREGHFTFVNAAYCLMFGKKQDELIGSSFSPLVHPEDLPGTLQAMKDLEKPPYRITVEQRAMTVKGWRWIAWEDWVINDPKRDFYEILGIGFDITERKQAEEITVTERDLAIILAQKSTLAEALPLCLDLMLKVSDSDCGGIYLVERSTGDLVLMTHKGLSPEFVAQTSRYPANSDRFHLIMSGTPVFQPYDKTNVSKNQVDMDEKLHSLAVLPLKSKGSVIACINVASHFVDKIPEYRKDALKRLAGNIGNMISRFLAQEELQENRRELQSMFDSLQDFVFVLDTQGNIVEFNQKVIRGLGYTREELIGKSVLMVHPESQRNSAWQIVGDMLAGLVDTCPLDLLKKDGSTIPVETKVAPGHWGNQEVLIGISRDITERKASEEAQLQQTKLLEYRQEFEGLLTFISTRFINLPSQEINFEINRVLKQIGDFERVDRCYVFLLDRKASQMSNTHEWCSTGVEPQIDNLQGMPIDIFPWWMKKLENLEEVHIPVVSGLPPEAQAERELLEAQSIKSVLVVPLVNQNMLIGFLGFDSVSKLRYWSPESILLIKMVGDIISNAFMRKQMENEIRQSEDRNRALLSAVPDLIFRITRQGYFLDFKAASADLLVISPEQIRGASIKTALDEDTVVKAMQCIENALLTKEIQTLEYSLKLGDSSHKFEARFKDSGENEVTAIIRDISDRARLEQMKSDFINRATHELRTPIATMMLMVNLLEGETTAEEYKEYWGILTSELSGERALVEDLLSAGRLENDQLLLHFNDFDINELIEQVIHHMEMASKEKNISISKQAIFEFKEQTGKIYGDEKALTQVFINLLGNAIKFTPQGGSISILLQKLNTGFEISINDTGMGIPSEDLPLLFTRFFRGSNAIKDEIPGTGIGLFIVRSILEKHGGKISASSNLGKGSTFDIWLPDKANEAIRSN
ncbi:MAG: PAS domain S-box protein [Chloroflexi bacterium]|nr:PAS domain S-box protein [Chloroflexota bacterium]